MTQTSDGATVAVDPAWLTEELERIGVARGATVRDATFVAYIGTGQMGRNARFTLTWDDAGGRPATVVGKFPTDDPTARATGFQNGSYGKEHVFYSTLRSTVGVRAPNLWAARYDEDELDFGSWRTSLGLG